MTPERFCALLEAYGADLQRWPEGERSAARNLATQHRPQLRQALADAAWLDGVLDEHQAAVPDDGLIQRILSQTAATAYSRSPIKSRWQWGPGTGLVLSGLAGVLAGAFIVSAALRDTAPARIMDWQSVGTAFSGRPADWSDE